MRQAARRRRWMVTQGRPTVAPPVLSYEAVMQLVGWDGHLRFRQADPTVPMPNYGTNSAWGSFNAYTTPSTFADGMRETGEAFYYNQLSTEVTSVPSTPIVPAGHGGAITWAVLLKTNVNQYPPDTIFSEENSVWGFGMTSQRHVQVSMSFNNNGASSTASFISANSLPGTWTWVFVTISAAPIRVIRVWQGDAGSFAEISALASQPGTGMTYASTGVSVGFGFYAFEYFRGWIDEFAFKLGEVTEAQMAQIVTASHA